MKSKIVLVTLLAMIASLYAQAELKIAVVDTDKVFAESVWGKNVMLEMEKEREKWQKEGERIDREIAELEEKLSKQRTFFEDKEEEQKLLNDIDRKRMEGQRLVDEGQESLRQKRDSLLGPILEEVNNIIRKLAIEEGYDLVLEKQLIVLYLKPELDITSKVTVMLDKVYKDKYATKAKETEKSSQKPTEKPDNNKQEKPKN